MKKYNMIIKNDGVLSETTVFAEKQSDIQKPEGFITFGESERVTHPQPEVLVEVLKELEIDVAKFYELCEPRTKALQAKRAEIAKAKKGNV